MNLTKTIGNLKTGFNELSIISIGDIFGKLATGLKIANQEGVSLRTVLASKEFKSAKSEDMVKGLNMGAASASALISTITAGVGLAITGISLLIPVIQKLSTAQQEAIDKANGLKQAFKDNQKTITDNIATIKNLEARFKQLSNGVDDYSNNVSNSADDYREYQDALQTILGITPQLITGYDEEGRAIANKNDLIQRSIDLLKEERKEKLRDMTSSEKTRDVAKGSIGEYEQQKAKTLTKGSSFSNALGFQGIDQTSFGSNGDTTFGLNLKDIGSFKSLIDIAHNIEKVIAKQKELGTISDTEAQKMRNSAREYINEYNTLNNKTAKVFNEQLQYHAQYSNSYDDLTEAQKNFVTQYVNGLDTVGKSASQLADMGTEVESFVDNLGKNENAKNAINNLFQIDKSASAESYAAQVKENFDALRKAIGEESTEFDEIYTNIAIKFGFDIDILSLRNEIRKSLDIAVLEASGDATSDDIAVQLSVILNEQQLKDTQRALADLSSRGIPQETRVDYANALISYYSETGEAIRQSVETSQKAYSDMEVSSVKANENIRASLEETYGKGNPVVDFFMEILRVVPPSIDTTTNAIISKFNTIQGAIDTFQSALDKINKGETLSNKEIMEFVEGGQIELADITVDENGFMSVPISVFEKGKEKIHQEWDSFIEEALGKINTSQADNDNKLAEGIIDKEAWEVQNKIIDDTASGIEKLRDVKFTVPDIDTDPIQTLINALNQYQYAATESEKTHWIDKANSALSELKKQAESNIITWEKYEEAQEWVSAGTTSAKGVLEAFTSKVSDLQSAYSTLMAAQNEYNEIGNISAETFKKLTENDLLQYLDFSSGKLVINTQSLENNAEAAKISAIECLKNAMATDIMNLATGNVEDLSKTAKSAIEKLSDEIKDAGEEAETSAGALAGFAVAAQAAIDGAQGKLGSEFDVDSFKEQVGAIVSAYTDIAGSIGNITIKSPSSSGSRSSEDPVKKAFEEQLAFAKHQLAMNEITESQYLETLDRLRLKYFENNKKYISEQMQYEEESYNLRNKLVKDSFDREKQSLDEQLSDNLISHTEYLDKLSALNDSYYKGKTQFQDEYSKNEREIYTGQFDIAKTGFEAERKQLNQHLEDNLITLEQYYADVLALATEYYDGVPKFEDELTNIQREVTVGQYTVAQNAFNKEKKQLDRDLEDKIISHEEYYKRLSELAEEHYAGTPKFDDAYDEVQREVTLGEAQLPKINYDQQRDELDLVYSEGLVSAEEYYNKLLVLNQTYYKDIALFSEEYRKNEIEGVKNLQQIKEQKLDLQLSAAEDTNDYNQQIEIYKQFQEDILNQADRYRELGLQETDVEIQELLKKYRAYGKQIENVYEDIVNAMGDEFSKAQKMFDKDYSKLEFKQSLTSENDYAEIEKLITERIDNRIAKSGKLIDQMTELQLTTDENMRSTKAYKDLMDSLASTYDNSIKDIYDLVNAQKSLAEEQISSVRDLQEKVIDLLKSRYKKEEDLLKEKYDADKKALEDEEKRLKERYDNEVSYIDDTLKALKKMWDAEDARDKKQETSDDINEIQRKINELKVAAETGDAEAISRIEDLQAQLKEKQKAQADDEEQERRKAIEDQYSDQKDALKAQYDLNNANLDKRQDLLDAEYDADYNTIQEKLKNANLYAEARITLEQGVNAELIQSLKDYEDEFGEGMGILGGYVKDKLTAQIEDAAKALKELPKLIKTATDKEFTIDKVNSLVSETLYGLTAEQLDIIRQMKANSDAWAKATTDVERDSLAKANETLGYAVGFYKDIEAGVWYLDESKTQKVYDVLEGIQTTQISNFESAKIEYDKDAENFDTAQGKKLESVETLRDNIEIVNEGLYETLNESLDTFAGNVKTKVDDMTSHLQKLLAMLNSVISIANTTTKSVTAGTPSTALQKTSVLGSGTAVQRYASGGLNREAGLKFLDPDEQVLTDKQTESFGKLVDNLDEAVEVTKPKRLSDDELSKKYVATGIDGSKIDFLKFMDIQVSSFLQDYNPAKQVMEDANRAAQYISTNNSNVQADFNFYGSITKEAIPQLEKKIDDAIYELKKEIPKIASEGQRSERRRFGSSW